MAVGRSKFDVSHRSNYDAEKEEEEEGCDRSREGVGAEEAALSGRRRLPLAMEL